MPKKEQYSLNKLEIRPQWNSKTGADYTKLHGKIAFNDENNTKAFEISIDNDLAKELIQLVVNKLGESRTGSVINSIKDKFML